jgi:glycosyltransferase-like protein
MHDLDASPLRIGLLTHSVNPRGGVVHTLELAHALQAAGHDVTVMAPAAPGQHFFRTVGCKVELAPVACQPDDMVQMVESRIQAYVTHLSDLLARTHFDILHAHDGIGGNALATLEDRGLIDGFVRTVHHLDTFDNPQLAAWQLRAFTRARQVLCVSRLWCDILRRDYSIEAAQVQNGVDTARFCPAVAPGDSTLARRLGLDHRGPVFLAVGGVEERKNTLRIFEAFLALRRDFPGAQLVIAGGASLLDHGSYRRRFDAAVAASAVGTGAGRQLVLTGPIADAEMPALFRLAHALLMPSLREGFGLVVLEALASGTPAVVSKMAPFTEYLRDGECFWADPGDAGSIAAAMRQASQPSLARSLALAQAPQVCRRFGWAASAEGHACLYRAMLAQPVCA